MLEMKQLKASCDNAHQAEPMLNQTNDVSDARHRLKQYCEQHKDPLLSPTPTASKTPVQDVSPKGCCTVM